MSSALFYLMLLTIQCGKYIILIYENCTLEEKGI